MQEKGRSWKACQEEVDMWDAESTDLYRKYEKKKKKNTAQTTHLFLS